jgi:hypothetical protein
MCVIKVALRNTDLLLYDDDDDDDDVYSIELQHVGTLIYIYKCLCIYMYKCRHTHTHLYKLIYINAYI